MKYLHDGAIRAQWEKYRHFRQCPGDICCETQTRLNFPKQVTVETMTYFEYEETELKFTGGTARQCVTAQSPP